uniref:Uncharacterized protein n=1 Tax=Anguilla anguilla TaxID=7936 RepID=A0A0E9UX50_ANGAN
MIAYASIACSCVPEMPYSVTSAIPVRPSSSKIHTRF